MVQENVKAVNIEVETVEHTESVPVSEVVSEAAEVDVGKMMSSLNWEPLENERLEVMGADLINMILEKIRGTRVKTSPNQHQQISYGEGRGRTICRVWFSRKKIVLETAELAGKAYSVLTSRELNEKNGLPAKVRSKILAEIRAFVKSRGWE